MWLKVVIFLAMLTLIFVALKREVWAHLDPAAKTGPWPCFHASRRARDLTRCEP